jgi:2-polyprenyl-3-methyl-5-hydroxy-6-metoxy-1,4-benzoquinol methylase
MFTDIQFRVLTSIWPQRPDVPDGNVYRGHSKLRVQLGDQFVDAVRRKTVLDFGCGEGAEAVEMALLEAERVVGLDIRKEVLGRAMLRAALAGVEGICHCSPSTKERADIIGSLDAFEHFADPAGILALWASSSRQVEKHGSALGQPGSILSVNICFQSFHGHT